MRLHNVAGFHGTRLNDAEVSSVTESGLVPLRPEERRVRLERALSCHPKWQSVAHKLDSAIQEHGAGCRAGERHGQVHLTASRRGLTRGFNHYLTHGSEFDQHVAYSLLGSEGKELLAEDGIPRVVQVAVPGHKALAAAHPHFPIEYMLSEGMVPNLLGEFLQMWSFQLAHPAFDGSNQRCDCGMVFYSTLPAEWIVNVGTWDGA